MRGHTSEYAHMRKRIKVGERGCMQSYTARDGQPPMTMALFKWICMTTLLHLALSDGESFEHPIPRVCALMYMCTCHNSLCLECMWYKY